MLTLEKFEEASEKVKEVTLETKLIYSSIETNATCLEAYSFFNSLIYEGTLSKCS